MSFVLSLYFSLILHYHCRVLFLEDFSDKRFKLRWLQSIDNVDKQGHFDMGYGPMTMDRNDGQGLKTEDDYRYYLLSRKMKRKYSNKNKTLVIQYHVIFPPLMECGGAYIKILGYDFEPLTFSSKTPYKIMFGPDVCGFAYEDRELKVILNYRGKYYNINQIIRYEISHIPQLFTLIIRSDNTYEIHLNMSVAAKGHIGKDFRMLRPKFIRDKKAKPPLGWEMSEYIVNHKVRPPSHEFHQLMVINPEFYENKTRFNLSNGIPYIQNPDYMKPWHPPLKLNPKYKGKWIPPLIKNPNYNENDDFYLQTDLGGVAIDVWQMSSGITYDNILITDNEKFARRFAKENWKDFVEAILYMEKNAKPYNQTFDQNELASQNQNQDDKHQEHIDDSGQKSCYNNAEALKNTIFGPSKEQLNKITRERTTRMIKMKEEMFSQLSPLPKFSCFDPRYFNGKQSFLQDYNLKKRLDLIDSRKFTDTLKFINENNLHNF